MTKIQIRLEHCRANMVESVPEDVSVEVLDHDVAKFGPSELSEEETGQDLRNPGVARSQMTAAEIQERIFPTSLTEYLCPIRFGLFKQNRQGDQHGLRNSGEVRASPLPVPGRRRAEILQLGLRQAGRRLPRLMHVRSCWLYCSA